MSLPKVLLLCGSRMALPLMRDLVFSGQLAAVAIPRHCGEFYEEVLALLQGHPVPVLPVGRADFAGRLQQAIIDYEVAIGLMVTFSYKLPPAVYELPPKGFFNIHPGPLPGYRGPDPVFRQIKHREAFAMATLHRVAADFDTGDIVMAEKVRIAADDTYGTLTAKLGELSARLAGVVIKMAGMDIVIPARPQKEEQAQYYQRQVAKDISICWQEMDAATIVALANACNPWNKGAVARIGSRIVRILEAAALPGQDPSAPQPPGTIVASDASGLTVSAAGNTWLRIAYVYVDEGFLPASRLAGMGMVPGTSFQDAAPVASAC